MIDLKLKDLRYLIAVADSGHFGRAAAKCFVSQPTLSAQLRKLERSLGVQLIERRPRRVALTPAGEEIAQRARALLSGAESIVELAQARRDPLAGPLRVALLPTVGPYLLPTLAPRLRRALPRLELMLYEYVTASLLERLQHGDIDLGILALPVAAEGCCTRELYVEPFVLAVPQSHPLAARPQVRIEELRDETLLLLEDGHCLRDQALAVCQRRGVHEKQDFRATSIETLRQMVAVGAGVTLLPALATRGAYGSAKGVTVRPFARPAPGRHIGAIWRKTSGRTAAIEAVCDQIALHNPLGPATLRERAGAGGHIATRGPAATRGRPATRA
jgi:LysR family transcriptional regulator, hydrogen peroxide-inducible genes activator